MRRSVALLIGLPLLLGFGASVMVFCMTLALAPDVQRLAPAAALALLCGAGLLRLGRGR